MSRGGPVDKGRYRALYRALAGEFLGTAWLVFWGTAAVTGARAGLPNPGGLAVPVAFGAAVATAILLVGRWSGAHLNPVVSWALYCVGLLERSALLPYALAQVAGAAAASGLLRALAGTEQDLGATLPRIGPLPALTVEAALTALLVAV
ncbi:MAG: aquaporin, partial [Clostridia bacterium]|nr:aquaporin [Clostridia bacterium]